MFARITLCLTLSIAALVARAEDAVTVEKKPLAVIRRVFDPRKPPAEMPALAPGELAVAHSAFGINTNCEADVLSEDNTGQRDKATVRITSASVSLTLDITIWLPKNAVRAIVNHEDGHSRISQFFYKESEAIARRLAAKCVGQTFTGEGATPENARKAAIDVAIAQLNRQYLEETQAPAARVNDIFDQVTDHGRNARITVDAAIAKSLERHKKP